jgi:hypothetical protein
MGIGMGIWETMQTATAIVLAMTAAVMSSAPEEVRREVTVYVAAALAPQPADLGDAGD